MVKVAIAAAGSGLAREVIDKLVATGNHQILALVRKDPSNYPEIPSVEWVQAPWEDRASMVKLLKGTHTVLCFYVDPAGGESQKNLLEASIEAGVKRFAPSEWSMGQTLDIDSFPWYQPKQVMRDYLEQVNRERKVIEYTLFQPGIFLEYLAHPIQTATHVPPVVGSVSMTGGKPRIIALEEEEEEGKEELSSVITLTSVEDIAGIVSRAVDYPGEWPKVGGISGNRLSLREVKKICEGVNGKPFRVDLLKKKDVMDENRLVLEDVPWVAHPSIPKDQIEAFSQIAILGIVKSVSRGAWTVSDEWNRIFPDYKFTGLEEYAVKVRGME